MNLMKLIPFVMIFAMALTFSCKKDDPDPPDPYIPTSDTPSIALVDVAPLTVTQFVDSIVFTISYIDGDGDLGFDNADSLSLELTDNRVPLTEKFHIPPLSPVNTNIVIKGELIVILDHTSLIDTLGSETTTYTIKLRDRAGNWSNSVTTGIITIKP